MAVSQSVRLARTSDVDDIAAVQLRAWRHDFANLLPASALASLNVDDLAFEWGRALLASDAHRVFVAVAQGSGDVVGAASVGPASDADLEGRPVGEIGVLFVDPDHQRSGHGSRLMHACVDMMRGAGLTECVTWVVLDDAPRRAFFASAGWGPDSSYRDLQMGTEVLDGGDQGTAHTDTHQELVTVREVRLITALD